MVRDKFEGSKNHYGIPMKFILHVKDHFTKLSYLTALPNKSSRVIAFELTHLFSLIGVPVILHSDNEKCLNNSGEIMRLLVELNPAIDTLRSNSTKNKKSTTIEIVNGRCQVPRDQGSVEAGNKFAKQILNHLRQTQKIANSGITWPMLLPRVMSTLNSGNSNAAGSVPAYDIVFNRPFWDDSQFRCEVLRKTKTL